MAMPNFAKIFGEGVELTPSYRSALKGSDCAIVMTEWDEFRKLRAKDYLDHMRSPNLIDARRIYDPEEFSELAFRAIGLGS